MKDDKTQQQNTESLKESELIPTEQEKDTLNTEPHDSKPQLTPSGRAGRHNAVFIPMLLAQCGSDIATAYKNLSDLIQLEETNPILPTQNKTIARNSPKKQQPTRRRINDILHDQEKIMQWNYTTDGPLTIKFRRKNDGNGLYHSVLATIHSKPHLHSNGALDLDASFTILNHTKPHKIKPNKVTNRLPASYVTTASNMRKDFTQQGTKIYNAPESKEEHALGSGAFGTVKPVQAYDINVKWGDGPQTNPEHISIVPHLQLESVLKTVKLTQHDNGPGPKKANLLLLALQEYIALEQMGYQVSFNVAPAKLQVYDQVAQQKEVAVLLKQAIETIKDYQELQIQFRHLQSETNKQQDQNETLAKELDTLKKQVVDKQRIMNETILKIAKDARTQKVRLVIPRAQGCSLTSKIHELNLTELDMLQIGHTLLSELKAMHEKGIVHNDIKPDNIMVDQKNAAKYVDYGFAYRAGTLQPVVMGTVPYSPPEHMFQNDNTGWQDMPRKYKQPRTKTKPDGTAQATTRVTSDARSDVYSLGLVLRGKYGTYTQQGSLPRKVAIHGLFTQYIKQLQRSPHPQCKDLAKQLNDLLTGMTAPDINSRYTTAEALQKYEQIEKEVKHNLADVEQNRSALVEYLALNTSAHYGKDDRGHNKQQMLQHAILNLNPQSTQQELRQAITEIFGVTTAKYGFIDQIRKRADGVPAKFSANTKMVDSLLRVLNNTNSKHSFECKKLIADVLTKPGTPPKERLNPYNLWTTQDIYQIITTIGQHELTSAMKKIPASNTQNVANHMTV